MAFHRDAPCPMCNKTHDEHDNEKCGFRHILHGSEGNGWWCWQPYTEEAYKFSEEEL